VNISVSATKASLLKFLSPIVNAPDSVKFELKISDGKAIRTKIIPVEIIPYKPKLEAAEVSGVEASSFLYPNFRSMFLTGTLAPCGPQMEIINGFCYV